MLEDVRSTGGALDVSDFMTGQASHMAASVLAAVQQDTVLFRAGPVSMSGSQAPKKSGDGSRRGTVKKAIPKLAQ